MQNRREIVQALVASGLAAGVSSASQASTGNARIVHRQPLAAPFEGLDAAFVEVTVPPGPGSGRHRHSGFVLGYVLEGEFLFAINGAAPQRLRPGDTFYEPPGAVHTTSASGSPDRPAKILAIIIGEAGKTLTTAEK